MAEKLTEREVQAMIALWSSRREVASAGPTVADVAEALEISQAEAEELAREVCTGPPVPNSGGVKRGETRRKTSANDFFAERLTLASLGLTSFFCAYLDKLLT